MLPTGGQARFAAGLGAATFLRPQQIIRYDRTGLEGVRAGIGALSDAEQLPAHGEAVDARFDRRRLRRRATPYPELAMFCPFCRHPDTRVIDSRTSDDGLGDPPPPAVPRVRRRFTTTETASLSVIKRNGVIEPFSREKVMSGVRKACQGRPVTDADLAVLAQRVEETIRPTGVAQIDTNEIGLAILPSLRELDEVAYLRFASVYQAFDSLEDFESAITQLRVEHATETAAADAAAEHDDR